MTLFGRTQTERREQREAERERNLRSLCIPSPRLHQGVIENCSEMGQARPKEPEPVRDESHRRWVASLPCFECGIEGYSNAAHPNSGKTKGVKRDDDECFPLCVDRPGIRGCHGLFDSYRIATREAMPAYEKCALEWTRQQPRGT